MNPDEATITGDVVDGVESNCVLLRTDGGLYLLIGGDRSLMSGGGRLVVRGRAQPGLVTTCQQGTPFQVIEARKA